MKKILDMDWYYIISNNPNAVMNKLGLAGLMAKEIALDEIDKALESRDSIAVVIENNGQNMKVMEERELHGVYIYNKVYMEHTILTNDIALAFLIDKGFKADKIQYFDNCPEAKRELAQCQMPVVIRPYGMSDPICTFLVREYGKGIEAIYETLEKSPRNHTIIESFG